MLKNRIFMILKRENLYFPSKKRMTFMEMFNYLRKLSILKCRNLRKLQTKGRIYKI
jgi:hypothetical protein